ncbi:restriction endonuclease [Caproicibacterium sp. BJN0003]|uniref:restriction endonuclease n=1 Tax=Caproicibacterium sp. BJN0003 TaxID=2994078 RepID=UPI00225708A0|nr:restriction endonuclease [Caproicibacterium sp. BJN0003]UZT82892.1 restriction endonuclease [Caproicibacterium sp. BJN0003]
MKKKIDKITMNKILKIKESISNTPNTIPNELKIIYNFKGRKSPNIAHNILSAIIDNNKGITVFDPFYGSGSFVLAAQGIADKVIGTEIDNYTFNATNTLIEDINMPKLSLLFEDVSNKVRAKVMDLYETECCGVKNYISKLLFDPDDGEEGLYSPLKNRENENGNNVKLIKKCPVCKKKAKKFELFDLKKIKSVEKIDVSKFPNDCYIENSRINITRSTGADKYGRIFTHRNKVALIMIQETINKEPACKERDVLEQLFVASIALSRIAMYGSSTDILYHVVGHKAQDMNVWLLFEKKYNNYCTFKTHQASNKKGAIKTTNELYNQDYATFIETHPALNVDIIYTDFPYTDQVPYLERNQLFRIWLYRFYDSQSYQLTKDMLDKEIVLTNAPSRKNKGTLDSYYTDIDNMFFHFNTVLKSNGLVFLTLKLGKEKYFKTYIEIINLARKNGFEYAYQVSVEKSDPTLRKQSAFLNTLINEMIVVFVKLPKEKCYWYIDSENYEFQLIKKVYSSLVHSTDSVTLSNAVLLVCNDMKLKYRIIASNKDKDRIVDIIKENFVVDNGFVQIDNNQLYLEIEDETDLFTKLYDLIPIYIHCLLRDKGRFVLEDIYFELVNSLCDGNPKTITQLLDDKNHQKEIERLILNYCKRSGQYYIEKKDITKPSENAIDISTLSGSDFEVLTKRLLRADGYDDVIVIGGAGDLGVDLIASKSISGKKHHYIFQCKRWASNVGSTPIQRLYAERCRRQYDKSICITTSGYTEDGRNAARDFEVDIIDGNAFMKKLDQYFPGEYYNGLSKL